MSRLALVMGVVVAVVAIALFADAVIPERLSPSSDRRARPRAPLSKVGQAVVALGLVALSAALIGGERWSYGTVAILVAAPLLLVGLVVNRRSVEERVRRGPTPRSSQGPVRTTTGSRRALGDASTGSLRTLGDREAPIAIAKDRDRDAGSSPRDSDAPTGRPRPS